MDVSHKTRLHQLNSKQFEFHVRRTQDGHKVFYETFVPVSKLKELEQFLSLDDVRLTPSSLDYRDPLVTLCLVRRLRVGLFDAHNMQKRVAEVIAFLHKVAVDVILDTYLETRKSNYQKLDGYVRHFVKPRAETSPAKAQFGEVTLNEQLEARLAELDLRFGVGQGARRERQKIKQLMQK